MHNQKDYTLKLEVEMIIEKESIVVSERISLLREKVLSTKPSVCTERAKFYTQIYKENEHEKWKETRKYHTEYLSKENKPVFSYLKDHLFICFEFYFLH